MCDQNSLFNIQGYVHLKNFLDKENCSLLTKELKDFVESGVTQKNDPQCLISDSIGGAPVFDSLLEQLTPYFEKVAGKRLFPTYSYARFYRRGEELKIHIDRPSCEISATITLGFEGDVWPIFFGDHTEGVQGKKTFIESGQLINLVNESRVLMDVGDAVLYKGMEKIHWREPYKEGEWQAQVFLHYVDADGPHAEWKYDKRPKLAHQSKQDVCFWHFPDAMTPEAARKLIESLESQVTGEDAGVGGTHNTINKEIRDVKKISLPSYRGIGATMVGLGMAANHDGWKFNITHSNQTDYLIYDVDGHYYPHVDTFMYPEDSECRKLTVLMFLNDDFEGGKLFIQIGHNKVYPPQSAGTCLVFPSFMLHGVEPVTKGVRRSIVTWLLGPWFK